MGNYNRNLGTVPYAQAKIKENDSLRSAREREQGLNGLQKKYQELQKRREEEIASGRATKPQIEKLDVYINKIGQILAKYRDNGR